MPANLGLVIEQRLHRPSHRLFLSLFFYIPPYLKRSNKTPLPHTLLSSSKQHELCFQDPARIRSLNWPLEMEVEYTGLSTAVFTPQPTPVRSEATFDIMPASNQQPVIKDPFCSIKKLLRMMSYSYPYILL